MTQKALISPDETTIEYTSSWTLVNDEYQPVVTTISNAQRVAQLEEVGNEFEVANPLYWKDCTDDIRLPAYLDTNDNVVKNVPDEALNPGQTIVNGEPVT